jgi:hypothetical protein
MRVVSLKSPLKRHQPLYVFNFGALPFDEKIRQSAALFWFGLRNDESFYLRAAIRRTIDASPVFMEYGLAKKIAA